MLILAIDTTQGASSVGLMRISDGTLLRHKTEQLLRGHDQVVLRQIQDVIEPEGFSAVSKLAVTVGPGSFTGVRIGLAAAQGLAIARDIEIVGISTLQAFAATLRGLATNLPFWVCVDARHGKVFLQGFDMTGTAKGAPELLDLAAATLKLQSGPSLIGGSGAPLMCQALQDQGCAAVELGPCHVPDILDVARLGIQAQASDHPAVPLYLKDPDVS